MITEAKDPAWRYKNIIYDLHNYYVHRKGQIQGYRHKFFYIFTIYLKYMGKSKENAIKDMQIYVDDDFKNEFLVLVDDIYNKHYNILKNSTIAEWLDFTDVDKFNSYACYDEEQIKQQLYDNKIRYENKRKEERLSKKNENKNYKIEFIKEHITETNQTLADVLGVSIRTIQYLKKEIK